MEKYRIKVRLLSDAIFGSGNAVPGVVDADVLHDENGFPDMKGKTLKGKIKEEFVHLCKCRSGAASLRPSDEESVERLFGKADSDIDGKLYISDLKAEQQLRDFFAEMMKASAGTEDAITPDDILDSMTAIRSFTAIDYRTGVAKEGALRRIRVINKDLVFYAQVQTMEKLSPHDEALLGASVAALRYLGTMETRGKGLVECRLMEDDEDITERCVRMLREV